MSILGDALLAGAVGGLNQYAKQRKEEEDEREAALAAAAERNYNEMRENLKANQQAKPYTYETMQDGKRGKVTRMPTFDPRTGERTDIDLGFSPLPAKAPSMRTIRQGGDEVNQQFNEETGQWEEVGRGPKYKQSGGGSGGGAAPKATSLTESQLNAMFGSVDENGVTVFDHDMARKFEAFRARNAQKDARYRDANFAAQQWANQVGFDPDERLPGTIDTENPGMEPLMPKTAGASATSPASQMAATDPRANGKPSLPPDVQTLIDSAQAAADLAQQRGDPAAVAKIEKRLRDMLAAKGYRMQ